jgi:hypothetical protein
VHLQAEVLQVPAGVDWALGCALWGAKCSAYLAYGELPFQITSHIMDVLIIYLTQQSLKLWLNHSTLKTSLQDEVLEELDETIQAMFAAIQHLLHIHPHLQLTPSKCSLQHQVQDHPIILKVHLWVLL